MATPPAEAQLPPSASTDAPTDASASASAPVLVPVPVPAPVAKREKKRSYTVEEKLAIVQAAKSDSLRAVARRFHVDRNCIRAWRDKEAQLAALHPTARRLPGAGRRPASDAGSRTQPGAKRKADAGLVGIGPNPAVTGPNPGLTVGAGLTLNLALGAPPSDEGEAIRVPIEKKVKVESTQELLLVGFQGKDGALGDDAAHGAFDARAASTEHEYATVGYARARDVVAAVERGEIEYGVLAVENSTSGWLEMELPLDRVLGADLHIVGEWRGVHELCLCAVPGTKREDVTCVLSHAAALQQCEGFLTRLETETQHKLKHQTYLDRQATWDTAGACLMLQQEGTRTAAAIATERAAAMHNLEVLERGVTDERHCETRYAIVARRETAVLPPMPTPMGEPSATVQQASLVLAARNEAQALFKIVAAFSLRDVSIVRMHSRPAAAAGALFSTTTRLRHWDYVFWIDYIVSDDASVNESLLKNLRELALWIKPLGSYSASNVQRDVEPPRWQTQTITVDVV